MSYNDVVKDPLSLSGNWRTICYDCGWTREYEKGDSDESENSAKCGGSGHISTSDCSPRKVVIKQLVGGDQKEN